MQSSLKASYQKIKMVVSGGFEPPTSTMSTWRSTTKLTDYGSPKLKSELKEYRKNRQPVKFGVV